MNGAPEATDPAALLRAGKAALARDEAALAEAAYASLARMRPRNAQAWFGLAQATLALGQAELALQHLARHQALVPGRHPWPALLRARALESLGRLAEAEAALRDLPPGQPGHEQALLAQAALLRQQGRLGESQQVLASLPTSASAGIQRIRTLCALRRYPEAAGLFGGTVAAAVQARPLLALFFLVPLLHGEGEAARAAWRGIRARLDALGPGSGPAAAELSARLRFALGDIAGFRAEATALLAADGAGGTAREMAETLAALERGPGAARPKVFVIGLSKTGTTSINAALARLGLTAWHWANPITRQMLTLADAELADALSDIPCAAMMADLAARWPSARFILTQRPQEGWQASMRRHFDFGGQETLAGMRAWLARPGGWPHGERFHALHTAFYTRHADLAAAQAAHEAAVDACFAGQQGRLLRFNLFGGHGWGELCGFLGLPVPDAPFPHENRSPG